MGRDVTRMCAVTTNFLGPMVNLRRSCGTRASSTGQLNTVITFHEIVESPISSEPSNLPIPLPMKAIAI